MKYPYLWLISAFALTLIFSCKKSNDSSVPEPEPQNLTITAISPSPDSLYNGATVTITGKNFSADTSKITLTLGGRKISLTSATPESITFTIPADLAKAGGQTSFVLAVTVADKYAERDVTVKWPEPHGWYYPATIPVSGSSSPLFNLITFPTDSIGFVQREKNLYRSTNGGITWKGDGNNGGFGLGKAFYSNDGKNAWIESVAQVGVSTTGTSWYIGPEGSLFQSVIIGLYTSAPGYGLVAASNGKLYRINGSFAASNISVKYQSSYSSGTTAIWQRLSAIDESNLMLTGNAKVDGTNNALTIVYEKEGTFVEYDLSTITTSYVSKGLQLIDPNSAVLIDGNNDVFKFYGKVNWVKLGQKATAIHFTDANTGYAAYNGKIVKTTDGGVNWKDEFTLRSGETIYSICSKNGKIWAVGNDATQGIILKYNP